MDPAARRVLSSLAAAGVRRIPRPGPRPGARADFGANARPAVAQVVEPTPAPSSRAHSTSAATPEPSPQSDPQAVLDAVAKEIAGCSACKLCEGRQHTVPGEGNPRASIVFVGEGPGADEDRSGRPFVGRAGQLLEDIISKGMKLARQDVFICNVVKCRPPANRAPEPDEAAACAGFLERQLLAISPKVICTLGASAAHLLLSTDEPVGRLRGQLKHWRGIPVIPTYHPAYLLRSPEAKKPTWEDIQKVMEIAGR